MKTRLLLALVALVVLAPPALADTLVSAGSWNPWSAPTQRNPVPFSGQPFWDNVSKDGTQDGFHNNCNIGYWVSNSGGCNAVSTITGRSFYEYSPAPGTTPLGYLGDGGDGSNGGNASTFSMTASPGGVVATPAVGVSALSGNVPTNGTTEFGWVPLGTTNYNAMLMGGSPVTFAVPSGDYAFYLRVWDIRPTWQGLPPTVTVYTSNTVDSIGRSHFAVFDMGGGHYIVGIEDKLGTRYNNLSDYDYNDLVVEITTAQVPEPASILLLGMGLVGGAVALRKRRRA